MRWDHVAIKSADIERSLHFYCGVLGLRKKEEVEILGKTFYFVGNESFSIEIEQGAPGEGRAQPRLQTGLYHVAFVVDDVARIVEHVRSHGVSVVVEPVATRPDRRVAFIEDPDGVLIQLIEFVSSGT